MAWQAPGAWKKPPLLTKKNDDSSFPGLKPAKSNDPATKIQYEELQRDEIMVLQAIYQDDFVEHQAVPGAWKACLLLAKLLSPTSSLS